MIRRFLQWCSRILPTTVASIAFFACFGLKGSGVLALAVALAAGVILVERIDHHLLATGRLDLHAALVTGWRVRLWIQLFPVVDFGLGLISWSAVARVHSALFVPDGYARAYGPKVVGFWLNLSTVLVAFLVNMVFVFILGSVIEARRRARNPPKRSA